MYIWMSLLQCHQVTKAGQRADTSIALAESALSLIQHLLTHHSKVFYQPMVWIAIHVSRAEQRTSNLSCFKRTGNENCGDHDMVELQRKNLEDAMRPWQHANASKVFQKLD